MLHLGACDAPYRSRIHDAPGMQYLAVLTNRDQSCTLWPSNEAKGWVDSCNSPGAGERGWAGWLRRENPTGAKATADPTPGARQVDYPENACRSLARSVAHKV